MSVHTSPPPYPNAHITVVMRRQRKKYFPRINRKPTIYSLPVLSIQLKRNRGVRAYPTATPETEISRFHPPGHTCNAVQKRLLFWLKQEPAPNKKQKSTAPSTFSLPPVHLFVPSESGTCLWANPRFPAGYSFRLLKFL